MKVKNTIEEIAQALFEIDVNGADYKLTKNEFEKATPETIKNLIGTQYQNIDWDTFKEKLIKYQRDYGFEWSKSRGQFGTIVLQSINLTQEVGEELAEFLMEQEIDKGNISESIESFLPVLYAYAKKYAPHELKINIKEAKSKFSAKTIKNQRFKFSTRSQSFELGIDQFSYQTGRKSEVDLGNLIEEKLKDMLGLDELWHRQEERKGGKYQNVDFEGYRVIRQLKGDDLEVVNIELKPSNSIDSVSDAISQGINYKEFANKTYIAIPLFNPQNFYDVDRFKNFVKLCEENGLGIISINLDTRKENKLLGLDIILEASKREILDNTRLNRMLRDEDKNPKEFCNLCQRVVLQKDRIRNCGWSISVRENSQCMKELMEQKILL